LKVRVTTEANEGGRCTVAVEDNGIGLDEKYADRIFGTFQRLHGREEYEGTGIGLSIARKIAWRHDGDITATASEGEGATFRLTLPLAPAQLVAAPVAGSDPVTQPQSERNAA
jgi:light-regulated signal transduction histidine kinase (bacteriophytochrome)